MLFFDSVLLTFVKVYCFHILRGISKLVLEFHVNWV